MTEVRPTREPAASRNRQARVGRPTVPSIWIGGEYVGGFDGGTGQDSPGIVDLAFRGTLRPMLEAAGALKKE